MSMREVLELVEGYLRQSNSGTGWTSYGYDEGGIHLSIKISTKKDAKDADEADRSIEATDEIMNKETRRNEYVLAFKMKFHGTLDAARAAAGAEVDKYAESGKHEKAYEKLNAEFDKKDDARRAHDREWKAADKKSRGAEKRLKHLSWKMR